jgi:hypothetical protein
MKQPIILLTLSLFSLSSFAQTNFTKGGFFTNRRTGLPDYNYRCMFHFQNGMGKEDSIEVQVGRKIIDSLHLSDSMVISILNKTSLEAKYSLKEKTSYEVNHGEKVGLFSSIKKDGEVQLSIVWDYIGQNDYGAKKSGKLIADFDINGNLVGKIFTD